MTDRTPIPSHLRVSRAPYPVRRSAFRSNGNDDRPSLPAYFEDFPKGGSRTQQFDQMKKVKKPFQILEERIPDHISRRQVEPGYGPAGQGERFAREDRRGPRSGARAQERPDRIRATTKQNRAKLGGRETREHYSGPQTTPLEDTSTISAR